MINEQYIVLLGEQHQIVPVPRYSEIEYIRNYVKSGIFSYHFRELSHLQKVIIYNPTATNLTAVVKRRGTPIYGNAVIAVAGETVYDQISGMSKVMAQIAMDEILVVKKKIDTEHGYLELGE